MLNRLWPTSRLAVQAAIIALVLCGSVSALVIQHNHNKPAPVAASSATADDSNCLLSGSGCTDNQSSGMSAPTAQTSTPTLSAPTPTKSSPPSPSDPSTSTPDMSELDAQMAKEEQCDSFDKTATETFYAAIQQAEAAYNAVIAEWNAEQTQPPQLRTPYSEFAADAQSTYNAISQPAYSQYASAESSLKAQGCDIVSVYSTSDATWNGQ